MKKKWVEPSMEVQKFIPDEYVAACYKIKCTTPNNNSTFHYIYDDTNGNGVWDKEDKQLQASPILGFQGCNKWHKGVIRDEAPEANGFVTNGFIPQTSKAYKVFWWNEELGSIYDYHVMVPGKENYETNPNAS